MFFPDHGLLLPGPLQLILSIKTRLLGRVFDFVDNTCRAQTVNETLNPQITTLLKKYKKVSGIPILMNTSFNDNGEPIVESPKDAISAFLNMDIDYLVMGDYIVSKQNKKSTLKYQ